MLSLLDLPIEILFNVLTKFNNFLEFKPLLNTSRSMRELLRHILVVIGDGEFNEWWFGIDYLDVKTFSLDSFKSITHKYHYFIFDMDNKNGKLGLNYTGMVLLKLMLINLQTEKTYHTVIISSKTNFNGNLLIRNLLPKRNSKFTEFYFPKVTKINGFDDLRILDNTNCYFERLKTLTIGSYSFQLFNIKAPILQIFEFSTQLKEMALNENVNVSKLSYSKFLSDIASLSDRSLSHLEIVNRIDHDLLNKFINLKVLKIYGDSTTVEFNFEHFHQLETLVINKCNKLKRVVNLEKYEVNYTMKSLDLSQNRYLSRNINVEFRNLMHFKLS